MWSWAITLDHLWSIAGSSGALPPVADTGVIENQRAGRDVSHHSLVGAELVIALPYSTHACHAALFLQWGCDMKSS
jgi:hypothetical protein